MSAAHTTALVKGKVIGWDPPSGTDPAFVRFVNDQVTGMDVDDAKVLVRKLVGEVHMQRGAMGNEANEFLGITASDCPVDCCETNCVITQQPRCGHPRKGGLQARDQMDTAILRRRNEAIRQLAHLEADAEAHRRLKPLGGFA